MEQRDQTKKKGGRGETPMTKREEIMIFLARTTFRGTFEPNFTDARRDAEKLIDEEDAFRGWEDEAKSILWSLTPDEALLGFTILQELKKMG